MQQEPAWAQRARLCAALGEWEAFLRVYLVEYNKVYHKGKWQKSWLRDHWRTLLSPAYWRWQALHRDVPGRIQMEVMQRNLERRRRDGQK